MTTENGLSAADVAAVTGNNGGWGGNMGEWILGIIALGMLGNGGWGFGGGFGGGAAGMYEFPWLLAGQQGINTNTNNGFDTLHLSNQLEGNRDAINSLQSFFMLVPSLSVIHIFSVRRMSQPIVSLASFKAICSLHIKSALL